MKRAIITGATGGVGIPLIKELLDHGYFIYAIVRPNSSKIDRLPVSDRIKIIELNIDKLKQLSTYISDKCNFFFHLAWDCQIQDDVFNQYKNVGYTLDAIEAASLLECDAFIGAGSQAEYGLVQGEINIDTPTRPVVAYGMAKLSAFLLGNKLADQLGIKFLWTRIFSIYGPGDRENTMIISTIRKLLAGEIPSLTKGEQRWDYLYNKDCARALRCVAERGFDGKIYCIGSGVTKKISCYIECIRDIINPSLELGFGEIPYRPNQTMNMEVDISELQKDTGFEPIYSFEDGIKETIEWCKTTIFEG